MPRQSERTKRATRKASHHPSTSQSPSTSQPPSAHVPSSSATPSQSTPAKQTKVEPPTDTQKCQVATALLFNGTYVLERLRNELFARIKKKYIGKQYVAVTRGLVPLACRFFHELFKDKPEAGKELCMHMRDTARKTDLGNWGCSLDASSDPNSVVPRTTTINSFLVTYENLFWNIERAICRFSLCAREELEFYSKCCAIVQSSCSGKSRLVLALAERIPTLYICQRASGERAYPPGTPFIMPRFLSDIPIDAVASKKQDMFIYARCVAFLHTAYHYNVAAQKLYMEAKRHDANGARSSTKEGFANDAKGKEAMRETVAGKGPASHTEGGVIKDTAARTLLKYLRVQCTETFWEEFWKVAKKKEADLWLRIRDEPYIPTGEKYWIRIEEMMQPLVQSEMRPTIPCEPELLLSGIICIDEARHFNERPNDCRDDLLTSLLRAARLLPPGFILLYMDTLSKLNVQFPHTIYASERMRASGTRMAVHTDLTNWNIGVYTHPDQIPRTIEDSVETECMSLYGRPAWSSMRETGDIPRIVPFAMAKLCSTALVHDKAQVSDLACLAVLASRVQIDMNPAFRQSPDLVGSHLGFLDHYDQERGPPILHVAYPSDPIVSAAASKALRMSPWILDRALGELKINAQSRMVEPGERGELVAQILCMCAMDRIATYDATATVGEFLKSLCGEDYLQYISADMAPNVRDMLLNGLLNFSHFVKVSGYTPNREDIARFAQRRAAIVCKDCQAGIDLVIPVVLSKAFAEPVSLSPTIVQLNGPLEDILASTRASIGIGGEAKTATVTEANVEASAGTSTGAETTAATKSKVVKATPVEAKDIGCSWATSGLVELVGRLDDANGRKLPEIPFNPAAEKEMLEEKSAEREPVEKPAEREPTGRASSTPPPTKKAPLPGDGGGPSEKGGTPIDATHISYIIIQCKNLRSIKGHLPLQLHGFTPFFAKIEPEGPRPGPTSRRVSARMSASSNRRVDIGKKDVDEEIGEDIVYPQGDRPYVALGLFFSSKEETRVQSLETYPRRSPHNKNVISCSLVNGHRRLDQIATRQEDGSTSRPSHSLEAILSVYPSILDRAKEGRDVMVKSAQIFGYRGSEVDETMARSGFKL